MTRDEAVNWIINISADIGKAEHSELWHYEQALSEIREMLESEPERKKGKWIRGDAEKLTGSQRCSICHKAYYKGNDYFNYCPNCGADMRGGDAK